MSLRFWQRSFLILLVALMPFNQTLFNVLASAPQAPTLDLNRTASRQAQLPKGIAGMMAEYIPDSGLVYLFGGYSSNGSERVLSNEIWIYDPVLDELTFGGNLPQGLALAAHVYIAEESRVYFFGGLADSGGAIATSDKIHTYDLITGQFLTLGSTLPSARARASAVYTPTGIFIVGGVDSAQAFSNPVNEILHFSLNSYSVTGDFALPDNWTSLESVNYWVSAQYIQTNYPFLNYPGKPSATSTAQAVILILGTHGFAYFDPAQGVLMKSGKSENTYGQVAGATVYMPLRQRLFIASGYGLQGNPDDGFLCSDTGILDMSPHTIGNPIQMTQAPIPVTGSGDNLIADTQNDAAAVYIPELDRMLVFGGFSTASVLATGLCWRPWTDNPEPGQYINQIYSISPEYFDEHDWTATSGDDQALTEVINPVAGRSAEINYYQSNPNENFVVLLQSAYRSADSGLDYLESRVIPHQEIADGKLEVTLPENISPSDNQQRVAAFCIASLDRFMPPNCREVTVALAAGGLAGVISRDLAGVNQQGIEPVSGAMVELRDADGDLLGEATTDANGAYDFASLCADDYCLGVGQYTLNVWRDYQDGDEFIHVPASVAVEIQPNQVASGAVTLQTSPILGPTVRSLSASHNGEYGDTVGTFLSFDHLPDVQAPQVLNTFTVETQDFIPERPSAKVLFEFQGTSHSFMDEDGGNGWQATFDMSQALTAGDNKLVVTAYDDKGLAGEPRVFTVKAIAAKSIADGWALGSMGVVWKPALDEYVTYLVTDEADPFMTWPDDAQYQSIDLGLFQFYNRLRTKLQMSEYYRIDGFWTAYGDGELIAQLLSLEPDQGIYSHPLSIGATYNETKAGTKVVKRTIDEYTIKGEIDLCALPNLPMCGEWIDAKKAIIYDKPLKDEDGRTVVDRQIGIGVDFKYEGSLRITGFFDGETWQLVRVRVTPRPVFGIQGKLVFSVDAWFAAVEVGLGLIGEVGYAQPVVFEPNRVYLDDPCVDLAIKLRIWMGFRFLFASDELEWIETLWSQDFPDQCTKTEVLKLLQLEDFQTPDYQPAPGVAIAGDGSVMHLWIQDFDPSEAVDLRLQYAYQDIDNGQVTSGTLQDVAGIFDPVVGFLADGKTIAAWSQVENVAQPGDTVDDVLNRQEIYAAFYNEGSGWSAPQRITDNAVSDGRLVIATYNNEATLAWVRDSDGVSSTTGDWQIVTRRWNGGSWESEMVVADNPTSADFEPATAYSSSGLFWLVWVRDGDGDMITQGDRRLTYATYDSGSGWSAAVQPQDWPARAKHPSIAFSPISDWPLVAMVVSPGVEGSSDDAMVGINNLLYAAWRGAGMSSWDVQSLGETRAAWPHATLYTDNHALIVMRSFGGGEGDGEPNASGQITIAEGRLNNGSAHWGPPGAISLPDDGAVWQIGAVSLPIPDDNNHPVPNGKVLFVAVDDQLPDTVQQKRLLSTQPVQIGTPAAVVMKGDRQATVLGGDSNTTVFELDDEMAGIDPYIEDVQISNHAPASGELVTVTVKVRNQQLRPMGTTNNSNLYIHLYCQDSVGCSGGSLDNTSYNGEMLFNEVVTFSLSYRSTGGRDRLKVVLDDHPMDLETENNEYLLTVGAEAIPGPVVEAAYIAPGEVLVQWLTPPDQPGVYENNTGQPLTYRVYRAAQKDGPWDLVGQVVGNSFIDSLPVGDSTEYFYGVMAYDVHGRYSPRGELAQTEPLASGANVWTGKLFLPYVSR